MYSRFIDAEWMIGRRLKSSFFFFVDIFKKCLRESGKSVILLLTGLDYRVDFVFACYHAFLGKDIRNWIFGAEFDGAALGLCCVFFVWIWFWCLRN